MPTPFDTLPPGPNIGPVWQLLRYSHRPLSFLEDCARRHGDPFTVRWAGYGTFVVLSDPDAVRDVFHGDPKALHSGEGNDFLRLSVGDHSVLVLDEEPHARQRRALLPPLKGDRMRAFFDAMHAATIDAVNDWPIDKPVATEGAMRTITLRVILQATLGLPTGPEFADFEGQVERLLAMTRGRHSLLILPLIPPRFVRGNRWLPYFSNLRRLDDTLFAFLEARRKMPAASRGDNVVADLLAATHEDGAPFSDAEIRDAVFTILVAGHETTSVALAWAIELIASRDDVMASIVEELRRVTGGGPLKAEHLPRLEYLDAAIRESLRLRTILPFVVRLTKTPFVAGGREYPAGVVLTPCNHLVHRRADLYPSPHVYRPERFLERRYAGHEWFPFGGGGRTCLGMAFALYEMKVVLATMLGRVRLARPEGARSRPVRRGITLAPDDGARVVVLNRMKGD